MGAYEVKTNLEQRLFLVFCCLLITVPWVLLWRLSDVATWLVSPLVLFVWACAYFNWNTTCVSEPEWHDYR